MKERHIEDLGWKKEVSYRGDDQRALSCNLVPTPWTEDCTLFISIFQKYVILFSSLFTITVEQLFLGVCMYFVVFVIVACVRQSEKECMCALQALRKRLRGNWFFLRSLYHSLQSSVESYCNCVFALALLYRALWLVKKSLHNFLNQSDVKPKPIAACSHAFFRE